MSSSFIANAASLAIRIFVFRLHEIVKQHVFVRVADFTRHFCGFIYVAQHIGRRVRSHLDQSMIVKIFAYLHDGFASQNAVFFLNLSARVAVFYQNPHHIATWCFAQFVFFGYGLFDFIF